jgi:hypothetical protein
VALGIRNNSGEILSLLRLDLKKKKAEAGLLNIFHRKNAW